MEREPGPLFYLVVLKPALGDPSGHIPQSCHSISHFRETQLLTSPFFFFLILFIYLFMAVLGLHFCARAFSSCGKWGPLFIAVRGPLTIVASPIAEHRLQTCRLSNCGSRA